MNPSVERKIKACRSLILAIAVVPGLVLVVTPWPIAIQVYHRPLWTPWQHAAQAPQIYVARVRSVQGIVLRTATFEVTRTLKGPTPPAVFKQWLGRVAGSNDVGKTFLFFAGAGPTSRFQGAFDMGDEAKPSSQRNRSGAMHFRGDDAIGFVEQIIAVQSAEERLSDDQIRIIKGWLKVEDLWPFLFRSGPLELLEGMPDYPRAAALAAKIREGP